MSMKEHREAATSGMRAKLARMGGKMGDKKHLERGGKCYAGGGAVGASDMAMGAVDGMPSKPSVSKPAKHKGKGKSKGKGDTHVNVVVMPKGGPDMPMPPGGAMPPPHPMPPPMPPPGPPMGGPPGGPPGMPPPGGPPMGPGGPPMMHASGGRVGRKHGGKVMKKKADGGSAGTQSGSAMESGRYKEMEDRSKSYSPPSKSVMQNAHDIAESPKRMFQHREFRNQAQNSSETLGGSGKPDDVFNGPSTYRKGGKVKRAEGGAVKGTKDGAGGSMGRMEKMKMYGDKAGKSTGYNK